MANPAEILSSPEYLNANDETKKAIFDKHIAVDPDYSNASAETQQAIQQRFGIAKKEKTPESKSSVTVTGAPSELSISNLPKNVNALTEVAFGKGPKAEMQPEERIKRLAEAGVVGMGVGGAVGWLGGPAGAASGAVIGGVGNVLAEAGEQATSYLGGGRTLQVLTGLTASAPAEALTKALPSMIKNLMPSNWKYLMGTAERPEVSAAVEAGRAKMAGQGPAAAVDIGETIQGRVAERQARAEQLAKRAERAKTGEINALRSQQELADTEIQKAIEQGPGKTSTEFDLGSNIRQDIEAIRNPQVSAMKKDYAEAYDAAMKSAQQTEAQGSFWGNQTEALDIKNKWKKEAKESSGPVASKIKDVLNDIWRPGYTLPDGTQVKPSLLSAKGIDQIVRQLGEVASGKEVEGYKGISKAVAGSLREDIIKGIEKDGVRQGGFYSWSGLGPAKTKYATSLENLSQFESKRAQDILAKQEMGLAAVDAEKLPKNIFGTESGLQEAKQLLPPEKVSQYAQQYASNELAGKNVAQTRKWERENSFLTREFPEVKQLVDTHANTVSSLESRSSQLKQRISEAGEKNWTAAIDAKAKKWVQEIHAGEDPEQVVLKSLKGTNVRKELEAQSKYLTDDPKIRAKYPQAVASHISTFSVKNPTGPGGILYELDRITPALEGSHLMTKSEISSLRKQAVDLIKTSKTASAAQESIGALLKKGLSKGALLKRGAAMSIMGIGSETPEDYKE
jgi:hypothetical protein